MFKISEIISKEIISVFEGEKIGTIKNVIFSNNYKKIAGLVFFDDEGDYDSTILTKDIYTATEDGVLIRNLSKISHNSIEDNNPINTSVFLLGGENLGKISDMVFDENFNVLNIITNKEKKFLPSQILKIGFDVCLIKDENSKINISAFRPQQKFAEDNKFLDDLQVKIVRMNQLEVEEAPKENLPNLPIKIKPSINTLLGKTATKTITGLNNEIIIREHALISKHTLQMAKVHNKTHELLFNSSQ